MISFFKNADKTIFAVQSSGTLSSENIAKLEWLLGDANTLKSDIVEGNFIGPRSEMITPWSTNAVEITQNMGIEGISRIEEFMKELDSFDSMLQRKYDGLNQQMFDLTAEPENILDIDNIAAYNRKSVV